MYDYHLSMNTSEVTALLSSRAAALILSWSCRLETSEKISGCYGDRGPAACAATLARFRTPILASHLPSLVTTPSYRGTAVCSVHSEDCCRLVVAVLQPLPNRRLPP